MHKRGEKICSTPLKQEFTSTSISTSDVKLSSSDSLSRKSVTRRKRTATKVIARPKKNVERKKYKRRKRDGKYITRRRWMEDTSGSEWEVQNVETKCDRVSLPGALLTRNKGDRCQNNDIVVLFGSPERVRDVGFDGEKYFALSPPLVAPRANVTAIEDKIVDKLDRDVFIPDEDKAESDNISPIFERSKQIKTYRPPMKRDKWRDSLLINKGSGDWLVDVRIPTASADLLWEKYVQDNLNELPRHFRTDDITKEDSRDAPSDRNSDTDTDDILSMLDEERKKLLKSKKLRRMKGSYNKTEKEKLLVKDQTIICLSDDEQLPSKSNVHGQKERKRKWITREDKFIYISNDDKADRDLRKANGKLMTFNEFNEKSKMKENENTPCLTKGSSKVRVKSVVSLKSVVSRTSDGNFSIMSLD